MINWRNILKIVEGLEASSRKIKFYITSNLTFLPNEIVEVFSGKDVIFDVTIDGPPHIHDKSRGIKRGLEYSGTFDKVSANVLRLVNNDITVSAKMVLNIINHRYISETICLHHALGARISAITMLRSSDSDGKYIDNLASPDVVRSQIENLSDLYCSGNVVFEPASTIDMMLQNGIRMEQYCGADVQHSAIADSKGNLYNCAWFVGDDNYRVGKWDGVEITRAEDVNRRFRDQAHIDRNGGCHSCNYRYVCGGPCPATRMKMSNDAGMAVFQKEREVKCAVTKPIVNALLWKYGLASNGDNVTD